MKNAVFTPEELAELAAFDAEVDEADLSQEERAASRRRDYVFRGVNGDKIFKAQRAYYEANREKIAEAQRAYREANREKIAEIGAAFRRWRLAQRLTQKELGSLIDLSQPEVSLWETGAVPIGFERIQQKFPSALEAFG